MIRTDIDPTYDYAYRGARFVPPPGKTLLVLGQTLQAIEAHVAAFPDAPVPGGWAAYWGIPSMDGVTNTFLNEHGAKQNHQVLVDRYPNTVLQSALWMVGAGGVARRAGEGDYDAVVRDFGAWAKTTARPIYLRIGYEFDGAHNALEPAEYVRAYARIVDILRAEGVENVAFVWHSYAAPPYGGHPLEAWYPGDDYVDWVAVSLFGHLYDPTPGPYADAVFDFARDHAKPVMIAESSPIRGISASSADVWAEWFEPFFSLVHTRNIKAVSFIDEDWTALDFPDIDWADARLQNNPEVAAAFFAETRRDRYLVQSPSLFRLLGFTP